MEGGRREVIVKVNGAETIKVRGKRAAGRCDGKGARGGSDGNRAIPCRLSIDRTVNDNAGIVYRHWIYSHRGITLCTSNCCYSGSGCLGEAQGSDCPSGNISRCADQNIT